LTDTCASFLLAQISGRSFLSVCRRHYCRQVGWLSARWFVGDFSSTLVTCHTTV